MGEIKSTLELVMERTRHLSLSNEEKVQQKRTAFDKRLQGLLQRYADGVLSIDDLQNRITSLQAELAIDDRFAVMAGIVGRIDPDKDNRRWLDLITTMAPSLGRPLEAILFDYSQRRRERLQRSKDRLREQLAKHHGIAGPAVVPNPLKNGAVQTDLAALRQQALGRLKGTAGQTLTDGQT